MFFKTKNQKARLSPAYRTDRDEQGYALLIVLIVVAIIALIFFAKGSALDKYKNSYEDENGKKEAVEVQLQGLENNMDEYNKRVKENL